ncbi:MAG TPA: sigma-54 dependent transcriptional regulator [Desulfobacteraceae bacterium]|nr:sigma-54 dependent transcriptional regulator [Desulfobacteraceae bacterium]
MKTFTILVVDDNRDFLTGIIRNLKKHFPAMEIAGAESGDEALKRLAREEIGVMLSDLRMPGLSGQELLKAGLERNPLLCVIMITGHGTVETAVEALKKGAWDFLTKPVDRQVLYHTVERAVEHYSLSSENQRLQKMIQTMKQDKKFVFQSPAMKQLQKKITAIAGTDYTTLITGESGSGKEYIARTIHRLSKRKEGVCHALNCPAIPEQLIESELFGHVKGAFTGAERTRDGFFLSADKGTLILDEIGDISPAIQAKLLKFLQDKQVKPVGSSSSKTADVRIIALTNQNLEEKIGNGSFREDLYYRLNVLSVKMPPLRQRKEDIPVLVREFILKSCRELDMAPVEIDPAALGYLSRQPWQGNVRELLNYVRRLSVFSSGKTIDLPLIKRIEEEEESGGSDGVQSEPVNYKAAKKEALDHFSRNYLHTVFEKTRGNIAETSRISGLERASIQKIIKRLDIDMSLYRG